MSIKLNNKDIDCITGIRSLVFCSAGDRINNLSWLHDLTGFDVGLAYYASEQIPLPESKYFVVNKDFKIPNFIKLISEHPEVLSYNYYFFIDDDIIIEPDCLRKWLKIAVSYQLDVSQPSLTNTSKADWPHLKHQKGLGIDIDQFVEIQCFCLSRNALRLALPFFFMAKTGAGLDIAIYRLCERHSMRSAVIHDLMVHHPYRLNEQTVRKQYSEFATFNQKFSRFLSFCFDEQQDLLKNLAQASSDFGDTRYSAVRFFATLRFISLRVKRKIKKIFLLGND